MPYGRFTYVVQGHRIVPGSRRHAFDGVGYDRLVLSACHPLFSASHRILVEARLRRTVPLGAAKIDVHRGPSQPPPAAKPPPANAPKPKFKLGNRDLSQGSTGDDVRAVQSILHVQVTGYFGPQTVKAVKAFQKSHHLPAVGRVGPATRKALRAAQR